MQHRHPNNSFTLIKDLGLAELPIATNPITLLSLIVGSSFFRVFKTQGVPPFGTTTLQILVYSSVLGVKDIVILPSYYN